jgi:hypothetical protein
MQKKRERYHRKHGDKGREVEEAVDRNEGRQARVVGAVGLRRDFGYALSAEASTERK